MKHAAHSAGVDLGGTWIRVHVVDESGRPLHRLRSPAPDIKTLPRFLGRLWRRWGIQNLTALAVGSRGVWLPKERRDLQRSLAGLARTVRVVSDVELALESALTPRDGTPGRARGILLLAGTGSIAVGRDERGRAARAGGLGPGKGDEGSGYWIGREYQIRNRARRRKPDSVSKTASMARTVLKRARRNGACRQIVREAQAHLAELVLRLERKLVFRGMVPVSWAGSLMGVSGFRHGVFRIINKRAPRKFKFIAPASKPEEAAARWAVRLQGLPSSFLTAR